MRNIRKAELILQSLRVLGINYLGGLSLSEIPLTDVECRELATTFPLSYFSIRNAFPKCLTPKATGTKLNIRVVRFKTNA